MNRQKKFSRQGATLVLLCVMLPVVLGIAAYAINVVYMELARTELQITTGCEPLEQPEEHLPLQEVSSRRF